MLLIDAGGGVSGRLGIGAAPGLAEVLAGRSKAAGAVVTRPLFAVLPGAGLALPASTKALRGFVDQARTRFDLVVVDAPAFADGAAAPIALADACDGLALVAGWDGLVRHDFVGAIDAVAERSDFLGVILVRTAADRDDVALAG